MIKRNNLQKFINNEQTLFFEKNGYAVVDFLTQEDVMQLRSIYHKYKEFHLNCQKILHTTVDTEDSKMIETIDREIKKIIKPHLKSIVHEHDVLISSFIIKNKFEESTHFHQDPTRVDEGEACSVNIWIPLQDVDTSNGNLVVIPGTHRLCKSLRAVPSCPTYYQSFVSNLYKHQKEVPLKSGEAIFFDHSLIHASTSNNTPNDRIAVVICIKSKIHTPWLYFYMNEDNIIEEYELSAKVFSNLKKNSKPPKSMLRKSFKYDFKTLKYYQLLNFLKKEFKNVSYYHIMKAFLKRD